MIETPYLLFLGDVPDQLAAKTAQGVVHWRPESCVGQLRLPGCRADLGLPELSIEAGAKAGARTFLVGVANAGGVLPPHWVANIVEAIEAGMDVASGLHVRLGDVPEIAAAASRQGARLHDVRHPTRTFATGKGTKRSGKRLLAVGTDCSVGKMYTTLAIEAEMKRRSVRCDFRATGQTGIMIAGAGVPVDAVVADFISGSVEWLSPARMDGGIDVIEGQGSLFHPSYAGVSLGLLHGAQPDVIVLCHEVGRPHMRGLPGRPVPSLAETLAANLEAARITNPHVVPGGVALNTSGMEPATAMAECERIEDELGLPAQDPVATGVDRICDRILECIGNSQRMANAGR